MTPAPATEIGELVGFEFPVVACLPGKQELGIGPGRDPAQPVDQRRSLA